jgi:predicted permease
MIASVRRLLLRLVALVRHDAAEADLAREMDSRLHLLEAEFLARGLSEEAARAAARRAFGGVDQAKERQRDVRSFRWLDETWHDSRYAFRSLLRTPLFTVATVFTLSLGIGATTAIFSVANALLLRPLPYAADSDRLVSLYMHAPAAESPSRAAGRFRAPFSSGEVAELQRRIRSLSHIGTAGPMIMGLRGHEDGGRLQGFRQSASIFPMLGVRPFLGRSFTTDDEAAGAEGVIIFSYTAWQQFFHADPDILERTVTLDTVLGPRRQSQYAVIGVMPRGFGYPDAQTQFWMPLQAPTAKAVVARGPIVARLADGVSLEAAIDEIGPVVREIRKHSPAVRYELIREQDEIVNPVKPALGVLAGAVAFLLLIACVNVANLLLARTASRHREIAVRAALGAGRGRLLRQALTESVMLALLGGAAGLLLAFAVVNLVKNLATTLPRFDLGLGTSFPRLEEIGVDVTALAFTFTVSLLVGVVFGLAPGIRHFRSNPAEGLRAAGSNLSGFAAARGMGFRRILLVSEMALALMLLVGGALLARSFVRLARVDAGYDPSDVLTFQVSLPLDRYPDSRLTTFAENLTDRLRTVPGVQAAAYANQLPMVALRDTAGGFFRTPDASRGPMPGGPDARFVSREYFRAMGIQVVTGRAFTEDDREGSPRVIVINESLSRREFSGENPLGQAVYVGRDLTPWQIVGVVEDVRQLGLDREPDPQFFANLGQWSTGWTGPLFPVGAYYAVRTTASRSAMIPLIRGAVHELDAEAALFNVATMEQLVSNRMSRPRMYAVLLGIFAVVGLLLAVVGIHGVMAYSVTQRTQEIGVRMAMGAQRGDVLGLVMRQSMVMAAAGIAAGLAGAALVTRSLESLLFEITPLDFGTFAGMSGLFAVVAALAAFIPARHATKIDPIAALRSE